MTKTHASAEQQEKIGSHWENPDGVVSLSNHPPLSTIAYHVQAKFMQIFPGKKAAPIWLNDGFLLIYLNGVFEQYTDLF